MWGCPYVHLNIHLLWGCLYGHCVGGWRHGDSMSCHALTPRRSWHPASRFWYPPHCHRGTYTSFQKVIVFGRLQAEIAQSLHDCLTARMFQQPRVPVLTYWTWCRHAEQSVGRAVAVLDLRLGTLLVVGLTTKTEFSGFDPYLFIIKTIGWPNLVVS